MKILLVEDSDSTRLYLSVLLQQYGYDTVIASDGVQALALLEADHAIHLVLTDWLMPNMDGLELCKRIRSMSLQRYVYLVVLTQKSQKSALIESMEAGADDFLFKPVDKDELRVRIEAGRRMITLEQNLAAHNQQLQQAQAQIQRDLQAAAHTQQSLLPKPCCLQGYQFDWRFYPSQWVAGDMLNYFPLTPEHIGFYQLDVSGHGIHSALLSFALYHRIINQLGHSGLLLQATEQNGLVPTPPHQVAAELNQIFQSEDGLYFTLLYGVIEISSGLVSFTQAGHPQPLKRDAVAQVEYCGSNGFPIGLLPAADYETQQLWLMPGEMLLIYSDGVTDCQNLQGETFGGKRLVTVFSEAQNDSTYSVTHELGQVLCRWCCCEASELACSSQNDSEQACHWCTGKTFEDDMTFLVIQRET
ncbi:SpoIIE family protein phosphatase [Candidatus Halobeggiatoa sp. HSG11]|nr:SpoIIE family protein phosphatase [Candidatus Halobeggiatoa sp. HSG11]